MLEIASPDNKVHIVQAVRKDILDKTGMNTSSFSRSLKRLINERVITGWGGTYTIDPELFEVGELKGGR